MTIPNIGPVGFKCNGCGRDKPKSGPAKIVVPMAGIQAGPQSGPSMMQFCEVCAPIVTVQMAAVVIPKESAGMIQPDPDNTKVSQELGHTKPQ